MDGRKSGIGRKTLSRWLLLLIFLWITGRVLQHLLLPTAGGSLLEVLNRSSGAMGAATAALILEAISTCGVLLVSFLAVEEMQDARERKSALIRAFLLALISEVPYDLLMSGKAFSIQRQNPLLGVLVCCLLVYYWSLQTGKGGRTLLIRLALLLAAVGWCALLKVEYGMELLLTTLVLWLLRSHPERRGAAGMLAAALCILLSPFFLAAPMGALLLHFYNGEKDEKSHLGIAYPMLLFLGWLIQCLLKQTF